MTEVVERLKERHLKATPQRLALLKCLEGKTHPTIEMIYETIKKDFPSISLATVYKNINTLKEEGLAVEINIGDGKLRYDINYMPHIHVVCRECGEIADLSDHDLLNSCIQKLSNAIEGKILRTEILVSIICPKCNR